MTTQRKGKAGYGVRTVGIALVLVVALATPAAADTSEATANALTATLGTSPLISTGTATATNDGTEPAPGTVTGSTNPSLAVLGAQTLLSVGVLPQQPVANPDGTSAACAGLVGTGGSIQIGPGGTCTTANLPTGGVVLNLGNTGVLGDLGLRADAILAQCTANSDGTTTSTVQLVNATLGLTLLGIPGVSIPLLPAPTPNTQPDLGLLGLGGLLTLTLHETSQPDGPGSIGVTALHLNLLNIVDVRIGNVTCGPNADTGIIPVVPMQGLPIAAATAAAVGTILVVRRRRRAPAVTA